MTKSLKKEKRTHPDADTHREEGHMTTKAEVGVMQLLIQDKEQQGSWEPPEARKRPRRILP